MTGQQKQVLTILAIVFIIIFGFALVFLIGVLLLKGMDYTKMFDTYK